MIYFKKIKECEDFISKHNINIVNVERYFKRAKKQEKVRSIFWKISEIVFIMVFTYFIGAQYVFNNTHTGHAGFGEIILVSILFPLPLVSIVLLLYFLRNINLAKIEEYIANSLKNKVKIFYSEKQSQDYCYETVGHENLSIEDDKEGEVYLYLKTIDLDAEGYIVLGRDKYTTVSGSISRGTGTISSSVYTNIEIIYIKNIKQKYI